jgi:hypothetical protein
MRDIYISGDYTYVVRVIKVSETLLTSTAVEKIIQAEINSGTQLGPTQRWELDTQGKQLFKGFTRLGDVSEPFLEKLVGGKRCVQSTAMASLGDESSPIVAVGVIGREDQRTNIEALAKYLAFTVDIFPGGPAVEAAPDRVNTPRDEPSLLSPNREPSRSMKPAFARPVFPAAKSNPKLKKGEIELTGAVEYIGRDAKRLLMRVDSITLPGSAPAKLDSSRLKTVLFDKLPSGVVVGERITVTGKNNGVGTPIRANAIQVAEPAP